MKPAKKSIRIDIHTLTTEIQGLLGDITNSFMQIGLRLYTVKESGKFKEYASHIETFNDYLKEVNVARSTAYACISIYEKFGAALLEKKSPVEFKRLQKALPLVNTQADAEDWIAKAESMPLDGYEDAIRAAKGLATRDACDHKEVEVWVKCLKCGKFLRDAPLDTANEA